jgi:hypothetical protein
MAEPPCERLAHDEAKAPKESLLHRLRELAATGPLAALLLFGVLGVEPVPAQESRVPTGACAASGQLPEAPFDPDYVEFVSNPQPFHSPFAGIQPPLSDKKLAMIAALGPPTSFQVVARVVGLRSPVLEILDSDLNLPIVTNYEMARIYSVDARLRNVLPTLRFGDLVKARVSVAQNSVSLRLLSSVEKIQGELEFFHNPPPRGDLTNRAPLLVLYRKFAGETLIVRTDGSIYYEDTFANRFRRQSFTEDELARLMRTFRDTGFNRFPSSLPALGEAGRIPAVTLVCTRHQRVLIARNETALAPLLAALEEIKAKAISGGHYVLKYTEKRPATILDWPFPNLPLSRALEITNAALSQKAKAGQPGVSPSDTTTAALQELPADVLAKLPDLLTPPNGPPDPNRSVLMREGTRLFRVEKSCWGANPNCKTFAGLLKSELLPADVFLAQLAPARTAPSSLGQIYFPNVPRDQPPAFSRLHDARYGLLWPADASLRLADVPPEGLTIASGEFARSERLYRELYATATDGLRFVEGGFIYEGVRVVRTDADSSSAAAGGVR